MADPSDLEIWVCKDSKPARAAGIALRGNLSDFVRIVHWLFQGIYGINVKKCKHIHKQQQKLSAQCTAVHSFNIPWIFLDCEFFFWVSIYYIPHHWLFCVGFPAPVTYRITVQGATRLVAKFSTSIKAERICKFSWATKPSEATERCQGDLKGRNNHQWSWGIWQMKTRWLSMIIELNMCDYHAIAYSLNATNINNNSISQCKSM